MRLYIITLLIALGFYTKAQTKTFIGIKAGGGASTAFMQHSIFPVVMDIKWLPGINGGIQVTHFPQKFDSKVNAGIQIGLNLVQKGWVQKLKDTSESNHKTQISYLELPVEAVGYFGNKNKYYVSAGIFLEYAIRANVDPTPTSAIPNSDSALSTELIGQSTFYRYQLNRDNRLNYGPRGAVGIFRETDAGIFRLEGFFSFSIRSVFDYEPIESGIPDLSLNYGAGISISYMFSFGKLEL
ncbi:MAG: PorT family protein [Cytophagales bacterium]|nr:PorT family protein [Cytophagales bacterium]